MHVNQVSAASPFVQVINVLCDQKELAFPLSFELGQCGMCGVWLNGARQQLTSAKVVEFVDLLRVLGEGRWCCNLFDPDPRPNSIIIAEGFEPGLLRDPRASENHNVVTMTIG